jgi:flagellar hook protein FlgE
MGILSSFNIGITGMKAAGSAMNVTGDNIANAGTFGFKRSRAEFQDILAKSLKGIDGGDQMGSGTKLAHITPQFTQGTVNRTENITDLAVNGNGFFAVETNFGRGFTRDGSFHFNKDGELINGDGYKVLGFKANEDGSKITTKVAPVRLANTTIPAKATDNVKVMMNLDSRAKVQQFDPANPEKTSQFNSAVTVYDNVGTQRLVTVYFNKAADNLWEYHAMIDGKDAAGGEEGKMIEMANGQLQFDTNGKLQNELPGLNAFSFADGAAPNQQVKLDFGESLTEGGDGNAARRNMDLIQLLLVTLKMVIEQELLVHCHLMMKEFLQLHMITVKRWMWLKLPLQSLKITKLYLRWGKTYSKKLVSLGKELLVIQSRRIEWRDSF